MVAYFALCIWREEGDCSQGEHNAFCVRRTSRWCSCYLLYSALSCGFSTIVVRSLEIDLVKKELPKGEEVSFASKYFQKTWNCLTFLMYLSLDQKSCPIVNNQIFLSIFYESLIKFSFSIAPTINKCFYSIFYHVCDGSWRISSFWH